MFLNEYEVQDHLDRWSGHEILGPASQTLSNLMRWTNHHSDGWPYWQKPQRASQQLQKLLDRSRRERLDGIVPTVSAAEVRKAYVPIKAFLTRMAGQGMTGTYDIIVETPKEMR